MPDDVSAVNISIGEPTGKVCCCIDPWFGPRGILVPSNFLDIAAPNFPGFGIEVVGQRAPTLERRRLLLDGRKLCVRLLVPASVLGGEIRVGQALNKLRLCSRRTPLPILVCRGHRRRTRTRIGPARDVLLQDESMPLRRRRADRFHGFKLVSSVSGVLLTANLSCFRNEFLLSSVDGSAPKALEYQTK